MRVVVTSEQRFHRTPGGAVWTPAQFPFAFWARYLDVFDSVRVVGRVLDVASVPSGWQRVDGDAVEVFPLPHYIGPWQYLRRARAVKRAAALSVSSSDAVILRVSSVVSGLVRRSLRGARRPYGVEVVNDPKLVFGATSMNAPFRPYLQWSSVRSLRDQCLHACAASYVTERTLQKSYPCPNFSIGVSDVQLTDADFVDSPRSVEDGERTRTLITVGSLELRYKAVDVLIDALGACIREGLGLRLVVVGDGRHRAELEARVQSLGLDRLVVFARQVPTRNTLRDLLDTADLFVLPSRVEGLPRAMIEAMARGLPCIGSTVGGIPELLCDEDIVPPDDVGRLANAICEVIQSPSRMTSMSARNLEKAAHYREENLRRRRNEFFRHVRLKTDAWTENHADHLDSRAKVQSVKGSNS